MSTLSNSQQWSLNDLKDKDGNPPPAEIFEFIKKFDKSSLLPCPRNAADLAMPKNDTVTPREMNSFIVFRRQLAHVAKQKKKSDDGKVLSRAASYIWRSASKSEKESYVRIAKELKELHYQTYPSYSYERRKRKTAEDDFIVINPDSMIKQSRKKKITSEPIAIQTLEAEALTLQEQVNEVNGNWFDPHIPLSLYDNSFANSFANNPFTSQDPFNNNIYLGAEVESQVDQGMFFYNNEECDQGLKEYDIPRVFHTNYTQEMQDMQQALYFDLINGINNAGMNQNPGILPLERSIDDFLNFP